MKFRAGIYILLIVMLQLVGCAGGSSQSSQKTGQFVPKAGSTPVALEFVRSFENVASAPYFPLEGLAGCIYTSDGSLVFCDEKRGKVYGLDSGNDRWYEFDQPIVRPYHPVDVAVDGFKVLVLENGSNTVQRFDLSGAYQDQLLDLRRIDPGIMTRPRAFAVDRDGSMVVTDQSEEQILQLDAFLNLTSRLGEPGVQDDQFSGIGGIDFLPDGRIIVADTGNSRLCIYGRTGFFESTLGGRYDPNNVFLSPSGVTTDRHGNIFVSDQAGGKIHVFSRNLRILFSSGPEMTVTPMLETPVDLAVGPADQLAVTDRSRQAILVYRIIYE